MNLTLKVWDCDDYCWVLAATRDDAHKAYLNYQRECHGDDLIGLEIATPEELKVMDNDRLPKYRFWPNDKGIDDYTFADEYAKEIEKDPVTPRLFAVSE